MESSLIDKENDVHVFQTDTSASLSVVCTTLSSIFSSWCPSSFGGRLSFLPAAAFAKLNVGRTVELAGRGELGVGKVAFEGVGETASAASEERPCPLSSVLVRSRACREL